MKLSAPNITFEAAYLNYSTKKLEDIAEHAYEIYKKCHVCPHACHVDRTQKQLGYCQSTDELKITASIQHYGEEPIFTQSRGVGNIFITSCNMQCCYCQNYQASQLKIGDHYSYELAAKAMLHLQEKGVHFIGWVSPSHVIPGLLKSLTIARKKGLRLPIIYNTSSYDQIDSLKLLEHIVDIYLPDFKYASNQLGLKFSKVKNYADIAFSSIYEMWRQKGALTYDSEKNIVLTPGVLIRHLILPNHLENTWNVLCMIALEISKSIPISLMNQFQPVHRSQNFSTINRSLNATEYQQAIDMAIDLGFHSVFTQDINFEKHNLPNFLNKERPFSFD